MCRIRSLPRVDVAVALALAAYGTAEAAVMAAPPAWFLGVLAATLPLAWRRRYPIEVIAWTLGMMLLPGVAGIAPSGTVLPLPLLVIMSFTAGRESPTARVAVAGAMAIFSVATIPFAFASSGRENSLGEDLVATLVIVGASAGAGRLMRVRRQENEQLQALTAQLASEQESRARAAVLEERARMARELHDIVAHSISLIAVQAAAADDLLERDPPRARASLQAVLETSRGALAEMRRLLSVLRPDEAGPGLGPQPGLRSVPELIDVARNGGLEVELREEGVRQDLPSGLDLSAYRILQEALTNVRKHADEASALVLVRYEVDAVLLEVSNPASGTPDGDGGHGLAGMRERARIYGGSLEAGCTGSRFVVRARLPTGGVET